MQNAIAIGKVYTISFQEDINQQILTVGVKDRIDFELVDGKHTIIIDNLIDREKTKQVELDIFRYINLKPEDRPIVGYVTIHPDEQVKLDFDMDKYNDLSIRIMNVNGEETTLLFTKLHECVFSDIRLCEKQDEDKNKKEDSIISFSIIEFIKGINITGIVIALSIITLGYIIFFIYRKKPKA